MLLRVLALVFAVTVAIVGGPASAQDVNASCPARSVEYAIGGNNAVSYGAAAGNVCTEDPAATLVGAAAIFLPTSYSLSGFSEGGGSFSTSCVGGSSDIPYGQTRSCSASSITDGFQYEVSFSATATLVQNGGTLRVVVEFGESTFSRTAIPATLSLASRAATTVPFNVVVTSDQDLDPTSVAATDLTVTGTGSATATVDMPVIVSPTALYFRVTPSGEGALSFEIAAGAIDGVHGVSNSATSLLTVFVDTIRPTATFSALPPIVGSNPLEVTLSFSEAVTGLTVDELITTNLTASNLQTTDNITYTFDVVASGDGPGGVSLPSSAARDPLGNRSFPVDEVVTQAVASRPEITFVEIDSAPGDRRLYRFNVSRPGGGRVDFIRPSVSPILVNASLITTGLNFVSGELTLTVLPSGGDVSVSWPEGAFFDVETGNTSLAFGPTIVDSVDLSPPTPTISFDGYDLENTFTARVVWDEDVTGFTRSDITPVGATLGAFAAVNASEYTVAVTAIDLTTAPSINIAANVAEDLASNGNLAANGAPPPADGTAPVLDITGVPDGFGGPQIVTVGFNWGERVLGFEDGDIAVTGGTLGPITGGPQIWAAQFTILGTEDISVTVAANAVLDVSGTPNAETGSDGAVETDPPTPTITYAGYDRIDPFTATITFDEDVTGFEVGDLVAPFAQLSAFTAVSASVYTVTVQGFDLLTPPEVSVPAGVAQDLAGNLNLAAQAAAIAPPDGVAPVVTITGVPDGFTSAQTATITFDWGEDVIDFRDADIIVTGGTLGPIGGGQQTWTASLSVDGDRDVVVSVAANAALDGSGMGSAAASVIGAFASGEIAEELIREFLGARSAALLAAQPNLSGLLDNDGPSGNISVTRGVGTVQIRTGSEGPIWAALNSNWSDIDGFETTYTNVSFGTHMYLQDETLLGVMVQLDRATSSEGVSGIEGTGWLIGPYYVARYGGVDLDARLLWGRTENEISPLGTYTDRFSTERVLAMVNLSGEIEAGATLLQPLVGWSYVEDRSEAYLDALSNPVAAQRVRLSQLEVALDWTRPIGANGMEFVGGMAGLFTAEEGGNGSVEGARGRLDLGLRRQGQGPLNFDIGLYADGLGQSGFEAYGIDLSVDWRF